MHKHKLTKQHVKRLRNKIKVQRIGSGVDLNKSGLDC